MRKFEVLNCKMEKTVVDYKTIKDADGNKVRVPMYRTVKAGEEGWYPGAYGKENIKVGDVLEFDDADEFEARMAAKCAKNTKDFKEIRRAGRPPKNKIEVEE